MSKKVTQEDFLKRAQSVHGDLYDYTNAVYKTCSTKLEIKCKKEGHVFFQTPDSHIGKRTGCPKCVIQRAITRFTKPIEQIKEELFEVHGNLYTYLNLNEYVNTSSYLSIRCNSCNHTFSQLALRHINRGCGCPNCARMRINKSNTKSIEQLLLDIKTAHGDDFEYPELDKYTTRTDKITIKCKACNWVFKQTPLNHIHNRTGCPKCVTVSKSKAESKWLDFLNIPNDYNHRQVLIPSTKYKVDGFNPQTNTVYEFLGDFWHGNPKLYEPTNTNIISKKTFGELYTSTFERFNLLKSLGYTVVYLWESDWKKYIKHSKV